MGPDRGPVASRIPLAQRYFHQGMALTWGFNPAEAARSFAAAAAIDPALRALLLGARLGVGTQHQCGHDGGRRGARARLRSPARARSPPRRPAAIAS